MRKEILVLAGVLSVVNLSSAQYVRPAQSMGMDSTNLVPFNALNPNPATYISSFPRVGTYACSEYAGSYGIPANATQGNVSMTIESNPSNPNYGQVFSVDSSGCSVPYVPPYSPPFGGGGPGYQMCWPDGNGGMVCQWF
jgi:hypothetical protein